jgi:hypothetical protein
MCLNNFLQVKKVNGHVATMSDGRLVELGNLKLVKKGDWLEVFTNLAIGFVNKKDLESIKTSRNNLI